MIISDNNKREPIRSKRMDKEMISNSVIKFILDTYIIKKRIYKRKRSQDQTIYMKSLSTFFSYVLFISVDHIYLLSKRQNSLSF